MAWFFLGALIALPVIEIALFIKSAQWIGLIPTIVAAIGAGAVGLALVRRQGFELMMRTRTQFQNGEVPMGEMFDALCLAVAGILLLLPGFFSDILAILLLLPPVRAALRLALLARMVPRGAHAPQSGGSPRVIDAEYRVVDHDR